MGLVWAGGKAAEIVEFLYLSHLPLLPTRIAVAICHDRETSAGWRVTVNQTRHFAEISLAFPGDVSLSQNSTQGTPLRPVTVSL